MSDAVEQQPFRYWAFISYSHENAAAARALARAIEVYRLPARLSRDPKSRLPRRLFPIFRDRDEFSSSADLGVAIEDALKRSRALVVLCSPSAKGSRWVNEEIRTFREHHGYERIYAVLLDGTPESAFPPQLTEEAKRDGTPSGVTHEPLWVDLRPGKEKRSDARLRLIAAILNVDFDTLKRRDRARKRLVSIRLAAAAAVVLIVAALAVLSDMKNPLTVALAWRRAVPPPTAHAWSSTEGFTCPSPANCQFETEMVAAADGGTVSVFGGRTNGDTACAVLPAVQTYDATTNRWRMRRPMPTARTHFAVAAIGGSVYAVGGDVAKSDASGDCVRTNVVEAYDLTADRWTKKAPLPEAMLFRCGRRNGQRREAEALRLRRLRQDGSGVADRVCLRPRRRSVDAQTRPAASGPVVRRRSRRRNDLRDRADRRLPARRRPAVHPGEGHVAGERAEAVQRRLRRQPRFVGRRRLSAGWSRVEPAARRSVRRRDLHHRRSR